MRSRITSALRWKLRSTPLMRPRREEPLSSLTASVPVLRVLRAAVPVLRVVLRAVI